MSACNQIEFSRFSIKLQKYCNSTFLLISTFVACALTEIIAILTPGVTNEVG